MKVSSHALAEALLHPYHTSDKGQVHRLLTVSPADFSRYPLRWNQSSIASLSWSSGTRSPISMTPSATGRVSSNMLALVKFRMEKLSSHFKGHGRRFPSCSYSTRTLRENMQAPKREALLGRRRRSGR